MEFCCTLFPRIVVLAAQRWNLELGEESWCGLFALLQAHLKLAWCLLGCEQWQDLVLGLRGGDRFQVKLLFGSFGAEPFASLGGLVVAGFCVCAHVWWRRRTRMVDKQPGQREAQGWLRPLSSTFLCNARARGTLVRTGVSSAGTDPFSMILFGQPYVGIP